MRGQWIYKAEKDGPVKRLWPTNVVLAKGKWTFEADPSLKPRRRAIVLGWALLGLIVLVVILSQFPITWW